MLLRSQAMAGIYVFTLAQVPVWISPWYLLLVFIIARLQPSPLEMLAAGLALTLSLITHEFGHALMARRFNLNPKVMLHGFGGLCAHDRASSNRDEALITAAGPLAGLLLGVVAWLYVWVQGPPANAVMDAFMFNLIWMSVIYSIFNLLPLWPMDGGQLFRLLMLRFFKPVRAERLTHITALLVLAGIGLVAWPYLRSPFTLLILGFMGLQNVQKLRQGGSGQPVRRESELAGQLLMQAEDAWARGDDDEAVRLCHQLRSEGSVGERTLGRAWQILGVAATRREDYDEALSYLKRAPANREVVEATAQCLYQLDKFEELRELTHSPAFEKLPAETRAQVMQALQDEAPAAE